jgi:hypothetical protein
LWPLLAFAGFTSAAGIFELRADAVVTWRSEVGDDRLLRAARRRASTGVCCALRGATGVNGRSLLGPAFLGAKLAQACSRGAAKIGDGVASQNCGSVAAARAARVRRASLQQALDALAGEALRGIQLPYSYQQLCWGVEEASRKPEEHVLSDDAR